MSSASPVPRMSRSHGRPVALCASLALLLLWACQADEEPVVEPVAPEDAVEPEPEGPPDPEELETVSVGVDTTSVSETLYAFMERFCPENGYGIEVNPVSVGPRFFDRVILLDQKDLDVGVSGYATVPTIIEQDLPVVTIAGGFNGNTDLIVRSDVEVNDWEDLVGLRIGAPTGSIVEHTIFLGLRERGVDPDGPDYTFMVPGPGATAALLRGELDAIGGWEPWPSQMVVDGFGYLPFDFQETSIGSVVALIQTHRDNVGEPKIQRFVDCLVDAADYLNANDEEHIEEMRDWSGLSLAVAEHAVQRFEYDVNIYMDNLRTYAGVMYEFGLTEIDATDLVDTVVDYSLLEAATGMAKEDLGSAGAAPLVGGRDPVAYQYGPPPEDDE